MAEQLISVPAANRKRIKGFLRGKANQPLVIFIHGLTGDPNEHHFFNGARFLERKGIASFRYYVYDSIPLRDATLRSHAADLDAIVRYFRKHRKKIGVVGHSYGGATILFSRDRDFDCGVLWDTTHTPRTFKLLRYQKALGAYLLRWHVDYLIGKKMVVEEAAIDWNRLGQDVEYPLKVISAEKGVPRSKVYAKNAQGPSAYKMLKKSGHTFDEDGKEEELLQETVQWLSRYL